MRKVLWCFGAMSVAAAAGVFAAADYSARHPQSLVGRCAIKAYNVNVKYNPVCHLSAWVARQTSLVLATAQPSAPAGGMTAVCSVSVPNAQPVTQIFPPPAACPNIFQPECPVGPTTPAMPVLPEFPQARINVEEEAQRGAIVLPGAVEESEEPALIMPKVQDEQEAVPAIMPHADDEAAPTTEGPHSFWMRLISAIKGEGTTQGVEEESETNDLNGRTGPYEDTDYHHQHPECPSMSGSCCPYTGRCYPASSQEDEKPVAPKKAKQASRSTHFKIALPEQIKEYPAAYPCVDTTEFRPTDARPYNFGPKPY